MPAANNAYVPLPAILKTEYIIFKKTFWLGRMDTVSRAKHCAPLHLLALLIRQRHIARRYAQCRGTESVLRTLALLLAPHSRATPEQAKEPKFVSLIISWQWVSIDYPNLLFDIVFRFDCLF